MSKETFKTFVRNHPELVGSVNKGEMTWQKFYEMYDMYGEDNSIWSNYFNTNRNSSTKPHSSLIKDASIQEIFNIVKKVDLDTVRKGINGLQKVIGIAQELGLGSNNSKSLKNNYQPRPMYKYFED